MLFETCHFEEFNNGLHFLNNLRLISLIRLLHHLLNIPKEDLIKKDKISGPFTGPPNL